MNMIRNYLKEENSLISDFAFTTKVAVTLAGNFLPLFCRILPIFFKTVNWLSANYKYWPNKGKVVHYKY